MDLIVNNRYQAIKIIGKGGFGKTFLAIDTHNINKPRCVIKQLSNSENFIHSKNWQLFITEIQRLQFLNSHQYIPKLIDFCQENNNYYIIQEFIDGENLQIELNKHGNYSSLNIIKLLKELLPILKFIHDKKIIHRDIKPANIIRKIDNQQLYLVDFGASKLLTPDDPFQTATVVGSPEYIAPEQARGKTLFASDIYSLGVTCLSLLTARSPFDLIDLDNKWIWQEYVTEKIDKNLSKILNKMVAFSLNKRYQKVEEIIQDLENIEQRKIIPWQTGIGIISILGIAGLINLFQDNQPNQLEKIETLENNSIINETNKFEHNQDTIEKDTVNQDIVEKEKIVKSAKTLEKEALEGLILLTDIQDSYYQKNGEFLDKTPYLPFGESYIFRMEKLSPHHIAIIALAKENNLKNFITMIWGGKPNTAANISKQKNYQAKSTDWGVFAKPNLSRTPSEYAIRFNSCETEKPVQKYPDFDTYFDKLTSKESLPLSYEELPCPQGYIYSLSMLELMSQKAAEISPSITYDIEGNNLTIK